jgi:hypothetical protein
MQAYASLRKPAQGYARVFENIFCKGMKRGEAHKFQGPRSNRSQESQSSAFARPAFARVGGYPGRGSTKAQAPSTREISKQVGNANRSLSLALARLAGESFPSLWVKVRGQASAFVSDAMADRMAGQKA